MTVQCHTGTDLAIAEGTLKLILSFSLNLPRYYFAMIA